MDEERLQGVGAYELKKLSVQNEKNSTRLYKLKPATTMITFRFCIEELNQKVQKVDKKKLTEKKLTEIKNEKTKRNTYHRE